MNVCLFLFLNAIFGSLHTLLQAFNHLLVCVFHKISEFIMKLYLHYNKILFGEAEHLTVDLRPCCEISTQQLIFCVILLVF